MLLLLVLFAVSFPTVEPANLHQIFFNATTPEEEASKYIAAGFGAAWITILTIVLACWLLRRRPVPEYTYELENDVGSSSTVVSVQGYESPISAVDGSLNEKEEAGVQCRRRQVSDVSLALSQR